MISNWDLLYVQVVLSYKVCQFLIYVYHVCFSGSRSLNDKVMRGQEHDSLAEDPDVWRVSGFRTALPQVRTDLRTNTSPLEFMNITKYTVRLYFLGGTNMFVEQWTVNCMLYCITYVIKKSKFNGKILFYSPFGKCPFVDFENLSLCYGERKVYIMRNNKLNLLRVWL